jgi:hypothetical protein
MALIALKAGNQSITQTQITVSYYRYLTKPWQEDTSFGKRRKIATDSLRTGRKRKFPFAAREREFSFAFQRRLI